MMNSAGTSTTTKEYEQMIRTTQRRMLRLIIQKKQKYKNINKKELGGKDIQDDEMSESTKEDSTNEEYDQDSSISFDNDTESTASQEEELEVWMENLTGSAREADETC